MLSNEPYTHTEIFPGTKLGLKNNSLKSIVSNLPHNIDGSRRLSILEGYVNGANLEQQRRYAHLDRYLAAIGREKFMMGRLATSSALFDVTFSTFVEDVRDGKVVDRELAMYGKGLSVELGYQRQLGEWDTPELDEAVRSLEQSPVVNNLGVEFSQRYDPEHPKLSFRWYSLEAGKLPLLICNRLRPEADYSDNLEIVKRSSFLVLITEANRDILRQITAFRPRNFGDDKRPPTELQNAVGRELIEPAVQRHRRTGDIDPDILPIEALYYAIRRHNYSRTS